MTQIKEVILCPDFGSNGDGKDKIWVIETPVKPGDFVMLDDTILTVESASVRGDTKSNAFSWRRGRACSFRHL